MDTAPAIVDAIWKARHITVLTGAGASAESGVPTFRDARTGLWAKFDPEQLATPTAFHRDPELVARWYDGRRVMALQCQPNAGHHALAALQGWAETMGKGFNLITQNVDRLHQRANSTNVTEMHGSLIDWRCIGCENSREEVGLAFKEHPPVCECGCYRRPGVVWFGERLPAGALREAEEAVRRCDLFFSIGTSGVVYPVAGLIDQAIARGARTVEINPKPTGYTHRVTWSVTEPSGVALPRFLAQLPSW